MFYPNKCRTFYSLKNPEKMYLSFNKNILFSTLATETMDEWLNKYFIYSIYIYNITLFLMK